MKFLALLTMLLLPTASVADCVAQTERLFLMEVWLCQSVTFGPDERNSFFHESGAALHGTLITGRITESVVVRKGDESFSNKYLLSGDAGLLNVSVGLARPETFKWHFGTGSERLLQVAGTGMLLGSVASIALGGGQ